MGPGVAYECSEQNGMHINEDHFILEVIDPETGEPRPRSAGRARLYLHYERGVPADPVPDA